ncbi:unnamed protein product [Closterium sp. NIES-64]|nr:unnamed protein product [Closterium sp. NIES-64]
MPVAIPEPFKGWALKAVRDFRKDFKALLKARSKLKKMKALNKQGVILHSIRTKAVEFQTKYPLTREKSAASVASVHHENQMRIQQDFIKSKELEVEEILSASSSHLTALATKTEDYIKGLTTDPELTVSDAAKERFRKIKGLCIEKAKSEVSNAIVIQELERQRVKEAEDLKKVAAAEEMEQMETDPAIDELIQKAVKKSAETMRREITASVEAKLTAKFKKNLSMGPQDPKPAPASSKPKADPSKDQKSSGAKADVPKATRKRGKAKKKVKSQGDGGGKGQEASSTKAQDKGSSSSSRFRVRNPNWRPEGDVVPEQVFKSAQADLSFLLKTVRPRRGHNLSKSAREAIRSLSLNRNIVIKPADKNVGITVMDRSHYVALCMEHLSDAAVYLPICHDPTPDVLRQLSGEYSFEKDMFFKFPLTRPLTFDPFLDPSLASSMQALSFLRLLPIGLAGAGVIERARVDRPGVQFMTVGEVMAANNHSYVDVLKVDCDGCEEGLVYDIKPGRREGGGEGVGDGSGGGGRGEGGGGGEGREEEVLEEFSRVKPFGDPAIGQILIDLHHVNNPGITLPMVYHLESVGYLLYHVEPNAQHPDCCIELAFIHQSLLQPWGTSRGDFQRWKKARGK